MKKALFVFALLSLLVSPSAVIAQAPPPKPTNADAVIAAFKTAGLEAESPKAMTRKDYGLAPYVCKGIRFLIPSLGEDAGGRAFFCPRKGDGDKLAKYYNSLGEQSAVLFSHVFQQPPYLVQINGDLPDEQAAKYEEALATLVGAAAPASATPNLGAAIEIQKVGYEYWGRPRLMDNPKHPDCDESNDKQVMLKLGISLAVKNVSEKPWPTGTRSVDFFKTDGSPAFTCYYDYMWGKPYPETPPGGAYIMSFLVFVEMSERVGYGVFQVDGVGETRFDIPQNIPLP